MPTPPPDEPVLLVHWERTVGEILDRTANFPKTARFTFASRIEGAALDILERLVSARYADVERRAVLLEDADDRLARLRVLVRLSHARRFLDNAALEHLSRMLDDAGRMLGGWRAHVDARR